MYIYMYMYNTTSVHLQSHPHLSEHLEWNSSLFRLLQYILTYLNTSGTTGIVLCSDCYSTSSLIWTPYQSTTVFSVQIYVNKSGTCTYTTCTYCTVDSHYSELHGICPKVFLFPGAVLATYINLPTAISTLQESGAGRGRQSGVAS